MAGRLQLNSCPADREGAVPFASGVYWSQAGWRQLPTPPPTLNVAPQAACCSLGPAMPEGVQQEEGCSPPALTQGLTLTVSL